MTRSVEHTAPVTSEVGPDCCEEGVAVQSRLAGITSVVKFAVLAGLYIAQRRAGNLETAQKFKTLARSAKRQLWQARRSAT